MFQVKFLTIKNIFRTYGQIVFLMLNLFSYHEDGFSHSWADSFPNAKPVLLPRRIFFTVMVRDCIFVIYIYLPIEIDLRLYGKKEQIADLYLSSHKAQI